jgi:hypothetical protein
MRKTWHCLHPSWYWYVSFRSSACGIYTYMHSVKIGSWVQSGSYPIVPGVRWPGREANHSPLSDTKVTNSRRFTPSLRHVWFVLNLCFPYVLWEELYRGKDFDSPTECCSSMFGGPSVRPSAVRELSQAIRAPSCYLPPSRRFPPICLLLVLISVRGRVNKPQGLVRTEGLGTLENFIHLIGSRTRDLQACSITPQPLRYCALLPLLVSMNNSCTAESWNMNLQH